MTLFEINLEKPALVEERAYATGTSSTGTTDEAEDDSSSGRSFGFKRFLGLLLVVAAVVAVRKLRSSSSSAEEADADADEAESSASRGKQAARAVGILSTVVGCVVLARKAAGGSGSE